MVLSQLLQLMDEVPMIYGTAVIGYCVYQVSGKVGEVGEKRTFCEG